LLPQSPKPAQPHPGPLPSASPTGSFPPFPFAAQRATPSPWPIRSRALPGSLREAHLPLAHSLATAQRPQTLVAWVSQPQPPPCVWVREQRRSPTPFAQPPGPPVSGAQPSVLLPHRNNRPFGAHVVHPRSCKSLAQLPSLMPPLSEPSPRASLPRPPLAIGALPRLARRPPEAVSPMSFVSIRPW
jgi:hypothetical protein